MTPEEIQLIRKLIVEKLLNTTSPELYDKLRQLLIKLR